MYLEYFFFFHTVEDYDRISYSVSLDDSLLLNECAPETTGKRVALSSPFFPRAANQLSPVPSFLLVQWLRQI